MPFVVVMFSKSAPWVCNQKMRFKLGMAHVCVNFTQSVGAQEQLLYASFTWCMYDLLTGKRASIVSVCYIHSVNSLYNYYGDFIVMDTQEAM